MGIVVIYHLMPSGITGGYVGVDVFFVISGFLITTHLLSKPPTSFAMLVDFWARRMRRLIPAALTVILATLALGWLLAPQSRWQSISWDAIASAFYFQNWRLAANSVDYLAAETATSPLQHYWSLSVEEQFYIFWPIIILLVGWFSAQRGLKLLPSASIAIGAVALVSLAYGVYLTSAEPAAAYFATGTRIWELGLGALVACTYNLWRPGRILAVLVAWAGMALIAYSAFNYTASMDFPGFAALVPTLGAALVIWAGSEIRASPTGPLSIRPIQWIGNASYSIYLWHWPLVVLVPLAGDGIVGPKDIALIVVATLVLSWFSKNLIEDKFRSLPALRLPRRSFAMGTAGMVLIAILAGGSIARMDLVETQNADAVELVTSSADRCVGGRALDLPEDECPPVSPKELVPDPAVAGQDRSAAYADDCRTDGNFTATKTCTYGDGKRRVALVGNSHAAQWLPAMQKYAQDHDMTITTYFASACTPNALPLNFPGEGSHGCQEWGQRVLKATSGDKFDVVVLTARNVKGVKGHSPDNRMRTLAAGYRAMLDDWVSSGANLLVLHDTPYPRPTAGEIPDCLAAKGATVQDCSGTREEWIPKDPLFEEAREMGDKVHTADLNDQLCRPRMCYGANGGVVTYFDGSHMTATYAATLSSHLGREVERALGSQS